DGAVEDGAIAIDAAWRAMLEDGVALVLFGALQREVKIVAPGERLVVEAEEDLFLRRGGFFLRAGKGRQESDWAEEEEGEAEKMETDGRGKHSGRTARGLGEACAGGILS